MHLCAAAMQPWQPWSTPADQALSPAARGACCPAALLAAEAAGRCCRARAPPLTCSPWTCCLPQTPWSSPDGKRSPPCMHLLGGITPDPTTGTAAHHHTPCQSHTMAHAMSRSSTTVACAGPAGALLRQHMAASLVAMLEGLPAHATRQRSLCGSRSSPASGRHRHQRLPCRLPPIPSALALQGVPYECMGPRSEA